METAIIKSGDKFNRLTIIEEVSPLNGRRRVVCKCDCGKEKIFRLVYVISSHTKSCGCLRVDSATSRLLTHGYTHKRLYRTWKLMKQRCLNPNNKDYRYYGARGITVTEAWKVFIPFKNWAISNGYDDTLTIERVDVNGNYEPSNCIWIPFLDQFKNRRKHKKHKA